MNGMTYPARPGQPQRVGDFNRATRQSLQTLAQLTPPTAGTAGQISRLDLPQSGFLAALWLILEGTTATGVGGSTTVETYPIPASNFLRRIRVHNNQGVELWNTSGYGAYLYNRTLRTGFDPATNYPDFQYAVPANTVFSRYLRLPTSLGASASETWRFPYYVPIAWGPGLQHGLQNLQDPAITYTLELTWGDLTDLYSATASASLSAVTVTPVIELYSMPAEAIDLPRLAFTKTVLEELQNLTAGTGENTYRFTTGNILTRLIHELQNEVSNDPAPIDPANVTNFTLTYSQTQVPYVIDPDVQLFRQRALYGGDLPQGVYAFELGMPLMLPELVGIRDTLNTARLTDLVTRITLSGVTLDNGFLRTIKEQLVANR